MSCEMNTENTVDNVETKVRRGRGRPKGSTAPNTLEIDINVLLNKGVKTVKVSRTWLKNFDSITTENSSNNGANTNKSDSNSAHSNELSPIEFTVS